MKKLFIAMMFMSSVALADSKIVGHQTPLRNELLPTPLHLSGACDRIKITEWRGDRYASSQGKIADICSRVSNLFYPFVKSKGYKPKTVHPAYNISILPAKQDNGGMDYRGLNDTKYRFKFRTHACGYRSEPCKAGETPVPVNGYIEYDESYIYMRNDVNTSFFARAMAHEMFHMFSYLSGVQEQEKNWQSEDERLAYEFTDKYWPND